MSKRLDKARQLMAAGRFDDATRLCRSTLKLGEDVVAARKLLAACLYSQSVMLSGWPSFYSDAEALLREAVSLDPAHADALNNLGSLLLLMQRSEEACDAFVRCARVVPGNVRTLRNLALAQEDAGRLDAAAATLRQLAEADPPQRTGYLVREAMLVPFVAADDEAIHRARAVALDKLHRLQASDDLALADPLQHPATYFRFTYHGQANTELNRALADVYAKACPRLLWRAPQLDAWRMPEGRAKIGIVSRFLRTHSVGSVVLGLFEKLDRTRFETVAIRLEPSPGDDTARAIDAAAGSVCEVPPGSLETAQQAVAALGLDVLFFADIGMEPLSYFLAFARLAPLQITWFGHPDTTGIAAVDAYVSWARFEVDDAQAHYTESLVMLPASGNICHYHLPPAPDPQLSRAELGVADGEHLYCCAQQIFKVQPRMDRLFLAIAERDRLATIVLFEPAQSHLRTALERRLHALSPMLVGRVRFVPAMDMARYLRVLQLSDVVLDTVHFNGYNTTLEAISVGTPVVTLAGRLQRERFGLGLYAAMGFMDLVAESDADYVERACRLASDADFAASCRRQIA
jgi:predicted O-linked N-acetylglucosamine transferase (SPINDLY family)